MTIAHHVSSPNLNVVIEIFLMFIFCLNILKENLSIGTHSGNMHDWIILVVNRWVLVAIFGQLIAEQLTTKLI